MTGLSAADMAKLQSGNLSEAEQAAIMNKMMQNKTGLSAADVQKLRHQMDFPLYRRSSHPYCFFVDFRNHSG